jgi:hypothetical protein
MKIEFHGAVRTVTGSQHLITVNNRKVLLDCGLYQGSRKESYARNEHLPFNAADVDALVLSHAHIDHSGNIPHLVKSGFKGDIICTYATRDLCALMLRDSAKIQQYDIEYLNKKHAALAAWQAWQAGGGCLVELSLCGVASWCTTRTLAERGAGRVLAELGHWWNAAASCPNGSPAARASSHALAGHRLREVEQPVAAFGEHTEQVLARCVPC